MNKSVEGIVIRQTKTTGGRLITLIFTREEGKISAGGFSTGKGKGVSALALRPFAYGQYHLAERRKDFRQLLSAESVNAFYALGEDIDRFAEASYVLEFTDKLLPEGVPAPAIFDLLKEYLELLSLRKNSFRLLTISYMVKVMQEFGVFPDPDLLRDGVLLSELNDDILDVLVFIEGQPLQRMETLTLNSEKESVVFGVIKNFAQKHLDLGTIKSERLFV